MMLKHLKSTMEKNNSSFPSTKKLILAYNSNW